jgi:FG-GAP-like repeat
MLDYDQDGWIDLMVANDTQPNKLYRNQRDGTFQDIAVKAGVAFSQDGADPGDLRPVPARRIAGGHFGGNNSMRSPRNAVGRPHEFAETAEVKVQMRAGHLDWKRLYFALRH